MIELRSLGRAEVETGVGTITPSQTIVFAAALYLILERGKPISRSSFASLLWPRARHADQIHRLRQTVYQLKTLGMTLRSDRSTLSLGREDARADIDHLERSDLAAGDSKTALEFLPGYAPTLSEAFQEWLDTKRAIVHSDLNQALLPLLREARESGNWLAVDRVSTHCLRLDAYNEAAVLARAEASAMRGQKAAAIAILDSYSRDVGNGSQHLELPVSILRRRILQHVDRRQSRSSVSKEPDFVGRGPEISVLTEIIGDVHKGFGRGCLIEGEPGIGKTRLSSELATFAELQGLKVERVSCKRADTDQPLSAFVTLVPRLRELPGALGCSHSTLSWLKRLTEFDATSAETAPPGEDSSTIYTHLRSAVFDLLDAVSEERPLLVIVEDIQWLDRASANLFAAILDWLPSKRIFLLFNSRESANSLANALSIQRIKVLRLTPLASTDARTLVRTMFVGAPIAETDLDINWLIETADGNPYFLQELAKYWIESGQKRDVPPSIAAVLDERLSRLSPIAHQLLQACAVLAEHCNLERLEQILEYRANDLLSAVQELSQTGMLRSSPSADEESQGLLVRHDLLSSEVLKTLAPASLAFLHRRCGVVLEREVLGPSISISLMRACAFHWYHSGDSERAYGLAIKCADHLLEIGLAADAAAAFEGALGFSSTSNRQLEVLARIIQATRMAADRPALLAAIRRFRAIEDLGAGTTHHDDIEILEFETLRTTERELRPVLARAVACVNDTLLPPAHRVKSAAVGVKISTMLADLAGLERVYREVEHLLADTTVDASARFQVQVIYHTMCGDLRRGLRLARERLAFERAKGITLPVLTAMSDLTYVLRRTGPRKEMFRILREGYDLAIQHNHCAIARDYAEKIASSLQDDELPGSAEWMERAVENGKFANEIQSSFSFNADSARAALRENRFEEARRILENGFDWDWLRERHMWLAAARALRIRLLIAEKAAASDVLPDVQGLRDLYKTTARLGRQDYELVALVGGLVYVGESSQAKWYLEDYLSRTRRDLAPINPELRRTVEQMGMSRTGEVSTLPEESRRRRRVKRGPTLSVEDPG